MAWLPERLALTLFLPLSWEYFLEHLAKEFQILLWNSDNDGPSVLGGFIFGTFLSGLTWLQLLAFPDAVVLPDLVLGMH